MLLLIFWFGGLTVHLGGDLINLLLILVVICVVANFFPVWRGRN